MNLASRSLQALASPRAAWQAIAASRPSLARTLTTHTLPLALIAPVCWYYGVTQVGWTIGHGETWRLTAASALPLCAMFYAAIIAGVLVLGAMVRWMADTYGSQAQLADGVTLISVTATPFYLAGFMGLAPALWFDIVVGTAVACWCIYLLYVGTPVMLRVREELGFLYASAVFAVALVGFVALLGATVVLWSFGLQPVYTY